ncbi:MAG: NUDIX hydrolase [Acidimicrobiia bacterium]
MSDTEGADDDVVVRAAGGVLWRRQADGELQVALVHRPSYDDWSLPKGKLDEGESDEQAARREIEEETGYACRLGEELGTVRYTDAKDRAKRVRYWSATPVDPGSTGSFRADHEVDECRWLGVDEARRRLTYDRDRDILDRLDR